MTLYLKYRSKNLDQIDLTDVREGLKKILSSENIPHAFLFSGPKGTGKTSVARIVAKIVNCDAPVKSKTSGIGPCDECEQCVSISKGINMDILEIDAASHRGIDDIRVLRDGVKLAPFKAKKKVYIIDEAHMLTVEASNALLKTLEEPPSHVVFILATTNPEKLLDTIRSRTTNILFKKANQDEIARCLTRIAGAEKKKLTTNVLKILAENANGSFRDAIKNLELLMLESDSLSFEDAQVILAKSSSLTATGFLKVVSTSNSAKSALEYIEKVKENGISIRDFIFDMLSVLKDGLLAKNGIGDDPLADLSQEDCLSLIELISIDNPDSFIEELPLEVAIVKWFTLRGKTTPSQQIDESLLSEKEQVKDSSPKFESATSAIKNIEELSDDIWMEIVSEVHSTNTSLEALLRASRPVGIDGDTLTLGVFYKFHKERMEDSKHRIALEDAVSKILSKKILINCILTDPPERQVAQTIVENEVVLTESKNEDIIETAKEIFSN